MHPSSREAMAQFRETLPVKCRVLDVGSLDINGSYKYLFEGCDYTGLDIVPGRNVDYIPKDHYKWEELKDNYFDAVISGQTIEHIEFPEKTFLEIVRVLKPGGRICIIGPTVGGKHSEPWFRDVTPDYMRGLANKAELEVISITVNTQSIWHDCIVIAEKPRKKKEDGKS